MTVHVCPTTIIPQLESHNGAFNLDSVKVLNPNEQHRESGEKTLGEWNRTGHVLFLLSSITALGGSRIERCCIPSTESTQQIRFADTCTGITTGPL